MNENMKKIIKLSDCGWIQVRGQKWYGGFWVVSEQNLESKEFSEPFVVDNSTIWEVPPIEPKDVYRIIWLPVGLNMETGNWQIDDLLMEMLKFAKGNYSTMKTNFHCWCMEKSKLGNVCYSDIILKLEWLRELIEDEKRGKL